MSMLRVEKLVKQKNETSLCSANVFLASWKEGDLLACVWITFQVRDDPGDNHASAKGNSQGYKIEYERLALCVACRFQTC